MDKPCEAYFAPSFRMVIGAATLLLCPGEALVATSVFRCVDAAGQIEFRQTQCDAGGGQRLQVETPKIGWLKSKALPTAPPLEAEQEILDEASVDSPVGQVDEQRCWQAQQRLQRIQWQLRKGYQRAQGERLRRQRREQQAFLGRFCR